MSDHLVDLAGVLVSLLILAATANDAKRAREGKQLRLANANLREILGPRTTWLWVACCALLGAYGLISSVVGIAS